MDLFEKLLSSLEPIGGELFIDRFIEARRAAAAARQPKPSPRTARTAPGAGAGTASPETARRRPDRRVEEAAPQAEPEPDGDTDTGKIRAEIEAFMNRDSREEAQDSEVQEFLKERSGFDPSELE